jgi:hypothetical protein
VIPLVIATLGLSILPKTVVRRATAPRAPVLTFPSGQLALAGINVSYADIGTLVVGPDRRSGCRLSSTAP